MLEQRYLMQGAGRHDHHPPHLHAAAEFAAARLQTPMSDAARGGGGPAVWDCCAVGQQVLMRSTSGMLCTNTPSCLALAVLALPAG